MTTLGKLCLACNSISILPDFLSNLVSLRFLDLSFNKITHMPDHVSCLTTLNALNLGFNPLGSEFPLALLALTSLVELNLEFTGGLW